jgi:hypothetical protein
MPSPFPGMDPYLEDPEVWPGFHDKLVNETVAVLQPQLRHRGYYVDSGQRVLLLEVRESFVDIFDSTSHEVVTGIEFVSPTHKSNSEGRARYVQKQADTRTDGIHLVEIDYIRRARPIVDVPAAILDELPPYDYLVHLGRRRTADCELYAIRLRDRLPRVRIPLKDADEDAVLDLQEVFDRSHAIGPYPERLDYSQPPSTPFDPDDEAWAHELLVRAGLRDART